MNIKSKIAVDFSSTGKGGGPYTSVSRIINSDLKEKYDFYPIVYKTELGRFISWKRILDLKKQIKSINPDIVHFSGLQLTGFHIAVACKLAKVKNTIVTVRGFSGEALTIGFFKKTILNYILEPLTILLSSKVYGVSEYVANKPVIRLFSKKSFGCIYNFPPLITQKTSVFNLREHLGLKKDEIIVVTVARINKDKGYHILDEAILKFANVTNLKFVIIGKGDYLDEMKQKLHKQVHQKQVFFLGYRSDIQDLIIDCDIFVLPTLHETLSVALLEASVAGLPLVASRTGGVPEIVENDVNGFLVQPGDVRELYEAINKLYHNKETREFFGQNAKRKVKEKFNSSRIVSQIDNVYQSLLSKHD